ncbi:MULTISPECIES: hypothetical protein [unclassified Mesorhizobium]|uniref:hypothetical protein n=1 Tax=unclassified Mesorhizobium TaxID=325217 RepID=UPI000BAFEC84|nr:MULTISPECIES: hypothetical protein [unclassified Mesorhizobium]PBC23475.1 hypothetical protein CK226_10135 [Mesorhizobium sp. WSM4311]TRD06841.1 hypothetical protein FJV82_08930 [Mesorhizobium sp. WSM4305]
MRISADIGDAGYVPAEDRHGVRIFLDGIEIKDVITADEECGYILRARRDSLCLLVAKDGELVTDEMYGQVKITVSQSIQ